MASPGSSSPAVSEALAFMVFADAAQETPGHISFQTSGWLVPTEASGGSRQTWSSEWQQLNSFLCENIGALIASSDTWDGNYSVPLLRH